MTPLLALLSAAATPAEPPPPPPVQLRGEVRTRGEALSELDLEPQTTTTGARWGDGERVLLRTRIGVEANPTRNLTLFAQAQDSRLFGQEPTTTSNTNPIAFRQAWAEIKNILEVPLSLRVGRQELAYGDQRLVGPLNWDNVGRTFDGVLARTQVGAFSFDAFWTRLHADPWGNFGRALGDDFAGLYGRWSPGPVLQVDAYVFGLYDRGGTETDPDGTVRDRLPGGGEMQLYTPGIRVDARPVEGLRLNGEFAYQTGTRGELDVAAWALHAGADYTFAVPLAPRLLAGYNHATGDSDPDDDRWETFENLFPTNHDKYGLIDLAAWKNLSNFYVGAGFQPVQPVRFTATVHFLARANDGDTFFRANGTPLRDRAIALTTSANDVGTELDLVVDWAVAQNVALHAGYSKLWSGAFLDDTAVGGTAPNPSFGYVQLLASF